MKKLEIYFKVIGIDPNIDEQYILGYTDNPKTSAVYYAEKQSWSLSNLRYEPMIKQLKS